MAFLWCGLAADGTVSYDIVGNLVLRVAHRAARVQKFVEMPNYCAALDAGGPARVSFSVGRLNMRIKASPRTIGWSIVGVITLAFIIALLFGSLISSTFVFFATMLFSYLPFLIFPFRSAFTGHSFVRGVFVGWANFVLGQFIFVILYAALYPKYQHSGWGTPEGNGVPAAMFIGWLPAMFVSGIAVTCARDNSIEKGRTDE